MNVLVIDFEKKKLVKYIEPKKTRKAIPPKKKINALSTITCPNCGEKLFCGK